MSLLINSLSSKELNSLTIPQKVATGVEVALVVSLVVFGILGLTQFSNLFPHVNALSWTAVSVGAAVTILELASLANLIRKRGQAKEEEVVIQRLETQYPQTITEVTYTADGKLLIPNQHIDAFKSLSLVLFEHIKQKLGKRSRSEIYIGFDFEVTMGKNEKLRVSIISTQDVGPAYRDILTEQGCPNTSDLTFGFQIMCTDSEAPAPSGTSKARSPEKILGRVYAKLELPHRMAMAALEDMLNAPYVFPNRENFFSTLSTHVHYL